MTTLQFPSKMQRLDYLMKRQIESEGGGEDVDLSEYAKLEDLNSLLPKTEAENTYATKAELGSKADKTDLSTLATKTELGTKADKSELENYAKKADLNDYATEEEVQDIVANVDLTNMVSLGGEQTITGAKKFTGEVEVPYIELNEENGAKAANILVVYEVFTTLMGMISTARDDIQDIRMKIQDLEGG